MTQLHMDRDPRPRRGLVSVALLIALFILGLVAASLLKVGMARRGATRHVERQSQVDALADSGIARALARLAASPAYAGETWTIPAADLGGRGTATVAITINPAADPAGRVVAAVAEYRLGPADSIRQTRNIHIPLSPSTR